MFTNIDGLTRNDKNDVAKRSGYLYLRISHENGCYLSRAFMEKVGAEITAIDFEVDLETGNFRFRLGDQYTRPLRKGSFCIPGPVKETIVSKTGEISNNHYYALTEKKGWWYGTYASRQPPRIWNWGKDVQYWY